MKPLIGITPSPTLDTLPHGTFLRHAMNAAYVDAVVEAGGVAIVVPPQANNLPTLLDRLDGVLLSGGGDIAPERYGDGRVHPKTYGVSPARDEFELRLARSAIERDLPLLGICRGIQVLNVALGGTLIQDIGDEHPADPPVTHRQQEAGLAADDIGHRVAFRGGPVAALFGASDVGVNSFHHQAIDRLAADLMSAGESADGIVEAVVLPDRAFVVAVQWHPELMVRRHDEQRRLFLALVAAAAVRQPEAALA